MFQSLEYKHPKFYQVFRLFIVFFASLDRVRFYPCQYTVFGV